MNSEIPENKMEETKEDVRNFFKNLAFVFPDIESALPAIERDIDGNLSLSTLGRMTSFLGEILTNASEGNKRKFDTGDVLNLTNDYVYAAENFPINAFDTKPARKMIEMLKRQIAIEEISNEQEALILQEKENSSKKSFLYNVFYLRKIIQGYNFTLNGRPVKNILKEKQRVEGLLEIINRQAKIAELSLKQESLERAHNEDAVKYAHIGTTTFINEIAKKFIYLTKMGSYNVTNVEAKRKRAEDFLQIHKEQDDLAEILLQWKNILTRIRKNASKEIGIVVQKKDIDCSECSAKKTGLCPGRQ